jgi:peptidoglycan hydrolase FlgJ
MNVEALSSNPMVSQVLAAAQAGATNPTAAQLAADRQTLADPSNPSKKSSAPSVAEIKKAASQFEAIILRQLLSPSIEPMMSGGMGGSSQSSGGGVYGYMLTDTLATSLSKGGGLGLAKLLEKQFTPAARGADSSLNSASKSQKASSPL